MTVRGAWSCTASWIAQRRAARECCEPSTPTRIPDIVAPPNVDLFELRLLAAWPAEQAQERAEGHRRGRRRTQLRERGLRTYRAAIRDQGPATYVRTSLGSILACQ